MENLNYFYENPPEFNKFIGRKKSISHPKTILYGVLNSGKSAILMDYLLSFDEKEYLYINLTDIRVNQNKIFLNLEEFLNNKSKIKAVGIDNFDNIFAPHIQILNKISQKNTALSFIISTKLSSFAIAGFEKIKISPLDFEEYMAFDKKRSDASSIFASFLLQGNGVKNAFIAPFESINYEQILLKSNFSSNEIKILKECANFVHSTFSANKIYTSLKEKIKISKDTIYQSISKFEDENIMNFLPKFDDKNAMKRLYFSNFLLKDTLEIKKDFQKKFTNALFCELLKFDEQIYYTKELDFYIPSRNMGILVIPFSASEIVFLRFKKIFDDLKRLKITKLNVISMANHGILEREGVKCEVLPFWQFALSF